MGFVKFARVFRFIGLFVGLNILLAGLLLMNIDKIPNIQEAAAQSAQGTGYTIEELFKLWAQEGLVMVIIGGVLMMFGIVCFIVFGVNKGKLESGHSSSSDYSSNHSTNYSPSPSVERSDISKSPSHYSDITKE